MSKRRFTADELASLREQLQVKITAAAALLDLDERTIRRMVARRELASVGKGRMRRIANEDIREWQRQNRQGGPDA